MHSNYLFTAPLPQGVLKSFWRAKIMSLYIKYSDHCLSKVVMKYVFGRIFNDKENSLCFKTNLSFLWKFILDHPSLTVGTLWFGIVLFFSPSLPEGRTHPAERDRQLRSGLLYSGLFDKLLKMTGFGNFSGCSATALTRLHFEASMGKTICLFLVG